MRHIQRFVVEEQEEQTDWLEEVESAKGMECDDPGDAKEEGWDDKSVWEYRQTGQLHTKKLRYYY